MFRSSITFILFLALWLASSKLRQHYISNADVVIEQPLSRRGGDDTNIFNREEIYVDLTVLNSSVVNDEQLTNSDRETLINNKLNEYESIQMEDIIQQGDESVYIRGVGGTGKTTILELFSLRWAKKYLGENFDFIFLFKCREINALSGVKTVEELFKYKYPKVFDKINISDLRPVSDRVLIIVDGLDELQDVYKFNKTSSRQLKLVSSLIDTKNGVLNHHKVIACGRPKACEFIKQQFLNKSKTIEVCGFNNKNISKFIDIFFDQNNEKAEKVKAVLNISSNLKIMATVPVFLWVICSVYSEELITKPLNTYTELYTYATLIFLRNHFRRTSQQTISLFEVLENKEIMNSVYALMKLSVQTYMENKVLFTDDDINNFNCLTHLEQTGFIVKYDYRGIERPVYQFRHLVLQEFFCGLSLVVNKDLPSHSTNRELSSCTPIIFGILRLMEENENDLFGSFFNKLLQIRSSRMGRFKKFGVMPLRHFSFKRFLAKNRFDIPECMIKENTLVINPGIPECQEFMTLLYESGIKLECPFTSAKVVGRFSTTDSRNVIHLMKIFNLKLKFPDVMVDEEKKIFVINGEIPECQEFMMLYFKSGLKLECPFTSAKVVGRFSATNSRNLICMLKTYNLKVKFPDVMVDEEKKIFVINGEIPECQEFMMLYFKSGLKLECPFTSAKVVGRFSATDSRNAILLLKRYNLKMKFPDIIRDGDTLVINRSLTFWDFCSKGVEIDGNLDFEKFRLIGNVSIYFDFNLSNIIKKIGIDTIEVPQAVIHQDTLLIDNNVEGCSEFICLDSTYPWSAPRSQFKFVEIKCWDIRSKRVSDFLNREGLQLKLPCLLVRDGVLHLENRVTNLEEHQFPNFVSSIFDVSYVIYLEGNEYVYIPLSDYKILVKKIQRCNPSLMFHVPEELVDDDNDVFIVDNSSLCQVTMKLINSLGLPLNVELKNARLKSANIKTIDDINTFLSSQGIRIEVSSKHHKTLLRKEISLMNF